MSRPRRKLSRSAATATAAVAANSAAASCRAGRVLATPPRPAGREVWLDAWMWAQDNRAADGSLPSGGEIARQYGRHERWGRLVKRSGLAGELST
jgi:hypothetical protein